MRTSGWVLAIFASAAIARGVHAEGDAASDGRYRIELRGGAVAWGQSVDSADSATRGAGPALGLGAGYRVTDHVELDASALGAAQGGGLFVGRTRSYDSVTAGGRYFFLGPDAVVRPWLGGEGGWYRARTSEYSLFGATVTRVADGGGVDVGTGFDVPLGRLVSIGTDVRYHQTLGVFDDPGFVTTLATVSFHFGR